MATGTVDPFPRQSDIPPDDTETGEDDLEAAYRRALAAVEAAEVEFGQALAELVHSAADSEAEIAISRGPDSAEEAGVASEPRAAGGEYEPVAETASVLSDPPQELQSGGAAGRPHPRQIIEAALFVGGEPATARKLCGLLRDEFDADFIEREIANLNSCYQRQNRPYEIRLGEGGFRLCLRSEHERLRNRVYGHTPREVRLSQEALEILALVAYRQPVSRTEIEGAAGRDPSGVLRQLLRRELIAIDRPEDSPQEVRYHTTPRFLQVFGLENLEELPRAEDLAFK